MGDRGIMTFSCPTCQKMINLTGQQAVGHCPHCQTELQAIFTMNTLEDIPKLRGPEERGSDARSFRPDTRAKEQV